MPWVTQDGKSARITDGIEAAYRYQKSLGKSTMLLAGIISTSGYRDNNNLLFRCHCLEKIPSSVHFVGAITSKFVDQRRGYFESDDIFDDDRGG